MLRIRMNSRLTIGLLVAALLLSPAILRAADVLDGGSFFSADALARANQTIRQIEQKTGHEIRIETFAIRRLATHQTAAATILVAATLEVETSAVAEIFDSSR